MISYFLESYFLRFIFSSCSFILYKSFKNVWMQICRTYLSKKFCISTFFPYILYFGEKIEFLVFKRFLFKYKKIYILLKNMQMQICKTFSGKKFFIITFFVNWRSKVYVHLLFKTLRKCLNFYKKKLIFFR